MSKSLHVHDSLLSPLGLSPLSRSVSPVPWLDRGTEPSGMTHTGKRHVTLASPVWALIAKLTGPGACKCSGHADYVSFLLSRS